MCGQQYDGRYQRVVGRLGGVHRAVFAPSVRFYFSNSCYTGLGVQDGNFARLQAVQLSELRWKRVARICPTAGVSTDAVCRSPQTISGVRSPLETAFAGVELQQGASARKDTSKRRGLGVLGWFTSRALFFDENLY